MQWLLHQWYGRRNLVSYSLSPFAMAYASVVALRRWLFRVGVKKSYRFPLPIIVVGNITVGGVGKTPLVVYIAQLLKKNGYRPGIVSRGYKGKATTWPCNVTASSDPLQVGDEAVMLAQQINCPLVVAPDRVAAVKQLLAQHPCDVVISDDGLQHYRLQRDIEIAVIDGERRLGNQFCLPAGPLRETAARLKQVDMVVCQGNAVNHEYQLQLVLQKIYQLTQPQKEINIELLKQQKVHAIAAIGHPQRFFNQLKKLGFDIIVHAFPDHYVFKREDIIFDDNAMVLMTAKDAVKCGQFADQRHYCMSVRAMIMPEFDRALLAKLLPK